QHNALGAPPEAVVDQLGILGHQAVLQVRHFTVQGDGLDGTVSLEHDGAAGGFVAAAGLHAGAAGRADGGTAAAAVAAGRVQVGQHFGGGHFLAVDGDDGTVAAAQLDVGGLVRCSFRALGPAPHVFFVLGPGVFQHAAFVGD